MNIPSPTLAISFLAGLASFLSPCVFSLVPAYIGYLGGRSVSSADNNPTNRWVTFFHGLAFVIGFSLVFITLGLTASVLGGFLTNIRFWLARVGGVVVIIFGLHMTGIFRIKFLEYDLRPHSLPDQSRGFLASGLMGIFFSAGWAPCVGPILGSILMIALNGGSITKGVALLAVYSAGLAIPFLIAALAIGWVSKIIRRYSKVTRFIEIAMGVILIVVGIMLFTGTFEQMSRFGFFYDFGL